MSTDAAIVAKLTITGKLRTDVPLLIGSGKDDTAGKQEVDTYVLKNQDEQPFIPGTSLAGVLRHLMSDTVANGLFGYISQATTDNGLQSAVSIDDIVLDGATIITRDGVAIDEYTGTGKTGGKYNYEAVDRGATGRLSMTITLRQHHLDVLPSVYEDIRHIADILASGAVRVGALTAKGFGKVSFQDVAVMTYDFSRPQDVTAWLLRQKTKDVYLGKSIDYTAPNTFVIEGAFALQTSLLVRDGNVSEDDREKKIHATPLMSGDEYVIPGTSLKGVLRHHAAYILRTLGKPDDMLNDFMGYSTEKAKQKSRFLTDEVYFKKGITEAKQTRNAIDRFTGSTMDSKLFSEKALWQKDKTVPVLSIRYAIQNVQPWEAGLALLLLKDLWTGRVALGGDVAVGRGYVQGVEGTITYVDEANQVKKWTLAKNGSVQSGDASALQSFVQAFVNQEGGE